MLASSNVVRSASFYLSSGVLHVAVAVILCMLPFPLAEGYRCMQQTMSSAVSIQLGAGEELVIQDCMFAADVLVRSLVSPGPVNIRNISSRGEFAFVGASFVQTAIIK